MIWLRRTDLLLVAGMAAGAAIGGFGLLHGGPDAGHGLPGDVVARVDGQTISRVSFDTAVGLVERDRSAPVSSEERRQILDRLVEEELLLQRGLALGLPRSDRRLRGEVVAAVIGAATAAAEEADPSPDELRVFFDTNRALFEPPAAMRVAQVFVASPPRPEQEAASRARRAFERLLAGEDLATVRSDLGDPPAVEIPPSLQPAAKLRDYVGPSAASFAQGLEVGEIGEPQRGADGYRVLVSLEKVGTGAVELEDRRDEVLQEYRRRAAERALADYLRQLRSQSQVELSAAAYQESR